MSWFGTTEVVRECLKCQKAKDEVRFRGTGTVCRECRSQYSREHYRKNRKPYLARSKQRNEKQIALLQEYVRGVKTGKPCMDCGKVYPHYVLDFDHRNAQTKRETVSRMVMAALSVETIKNEIEKCDLICSNCHRIRTWRRAHAEGL